MIYCYNLLDHHILLESGKCSLCNNTRKQILDKEHYKRLVGYFIVGGKK